MHVCACVRAMLVCVPPRPQITSGVIYTLCEVRVTDESWESRESRDARREECGKN